MKKTICLALALLASIPCLLLAEEVPRILAMEVPKETLPGKNTLWVNLAQLQALSGELTVAVPAAVIALLDRQDRVLANFGSVRKGKCKWDYKTVQDKFLAVDFAAADYSQLAPGIIDRVAMPGFQLAAVDGRTRTIFQSIPVVFWDMPDLAVQLTYPVTAAPGQSLRQDVTVQLENKGSIAAKDIHLDIVLSQDDKVQWRGPGTAGDDVPLENGRETVPLLEPGRQISVQFTGDLRIPENMPPGKHYLAVIADAEGRISEPTRENNVQSGFIMISVPEPKAFSLALPETLLYFEPANYGFQIVSQGAILSDGKDWKLCKMKPNVYQIKHVSWSDFFWEIDTYEQQVWEVRGADFCKKGGRARELKIKVDVTGGSLLAPPSRFTLTLPETRLRFEPGSKAFSLTTLGKPIFHLPFWWVCKRESYLYQLRYILWQDFFWQVDTFKKEASRIRDGKFCSGEGKAEALPLPVLVE
jgi:hypothetical protein